VSAVGACISKEEKMTHPNNVKRFQDVLDRLEAGGTYQEERETLIDIFYSLGGGRIRKDEIGASAAETAELIAEHPDVRFALDTEVGVLTLEMQPR
jgi:hypothetical protein